MYTLILGMILVAAFIWFNTSKKVRFPKRAIWLEKVVAKRTKAQVISAVLAISSLLATVYLQGLGAGIFAWLIYGMGFLSLIVLLFPYQYLTYKHVLILFAFCLVFELTFTYISSR
ncbi:hypothetical protein [Sphingobacterium hotanense]|uniref:hypothetical protein n=1 Tax=Sphingobacterium hotanense TaxID=649196 RepID=UPI0011F2C1BD|nr:hypothetical protein [Sphingobacterium hotanense]